MYGKQDDAPQVRLVFRYYYYFEPASLLKAGIGTCRSCGGPFARRTSLSLATQLKLHPHRMREFTSRPAGGAIMQCQSSRRLAQVLLPMCICRGPDMYIRECPAAGQYEPSPAAGPLFECRLDMHSLNLDYVEACPLRKLWVQRKLHARPSRCLLQEQAPGPNSGEAEGFGGPVW
ncbi:hypothetical protein DFH06DRAFT_1129883 [Mycena polygramma]|nr:hypothetical protein DFH06DRAFT_1129883 [Mycena polygramma]